MAKGKDEFHHAFDRIAFDSPVVVRNLIVFPVRSDGGGNGGMISLHRALGDGTLKVIDSGRVEEVNIHNLKDQVVVGIDGQEVVGGFQNRVLNFSVVIQQRDRCKVPTLCVERERWDNAETGFSQGRIAYPTLRTVIARTTYMNDANLQNKVWDTINRGFKTMRSHSATSSMFDLFSSVEEDIAAIARQMPCEENQVGAGVLVGGKYFCLDMFSSPALFDEFYSILAQSYAMDALLHHRKPMAWDKLGGLPSRLSQELESAELTGHHGRTPGNSLSVNSPRFQGRVLFDSDRLVHLSSFAEI